MEELETVKKGKWVGSVGRKRECSVDGLETVEKSLKW